MLRMSLLLQYYCTCTVVQHRRWLWQSKSVSTFKDLKIQSCSYSNTSRTIMIHFEIIFKNQQYLQRTNPIWKILLCVIEFPKVSRYHCFEDETLFCESSSFIITAHWFGQKGQKFSITDVFCLYFFSLEKCRSIQIEDWDTQFNNRVRYRLLLTMTFNFPWRKYVSLYWTKKGFEKAAAEAAAQATLWMSPSSIWGMCLFK